MLEKINIQQQNEIEINREEKDGGNISSMKAQI